MSRVIIVLGVGRSGTSVVGGILHKLGVDMGSAFVGSTPSNRYGTFEEIEFFEFNRAHISNRLGDGFDCGRWAQEYIARRSDSHAIWGLKDPSVLHTLPILLSNLGSDVRIVVAERDKLATISSFMFAYHVKQNVAHEWYASQRDSIDKFIGEWAGPILYVDYDGIIDPSSRMGEIERVSDFVFENIGRPPETSILRAYDHVVADGRRFLPGGKWVKSVGSYRGDGWGRVAAGVRIAKHPEYNFFVSWTELLTGGMRSGDKILMPVGWMPAHWASNAIVRDFMRTDHDSLLLVDDDMVFGQNTLSIMRDNKDNWDYDIVFGFCTHRQWPPKPVVMVEREEQPGLPMSLYGRSYDIIHGVSSGDIVEVDAVGLAFTLIKRHVLEQMTGEYGPMYTDYFSYGGGFESDDIPFCMRAREMGFRMAVDTNVKIGHIGQSIFGWDDYQKWYMQQSRPDVIDFQASDLIPILQEAIPHLGETRQAAENALAIMGGMPA